MSSAFFLVIADDNEVNDLAAGREAGKPILLGSRSYSQKIRKGETGVVYEEPIVGSPIQPGLLVVLAEDQRRLFGRFSQLRSDLSPLTAWCHVVTPEYLTLLDNLERHPSLNGYEAAWCGLVIAEAMLLADRGISRIKLSACHATQSFAVGRALALWGSTTKREVLEGFDATQKLFRSLSSPSGRLREVLEPIWNTLDDAAQVNRSGSSALSSAVRQLASARAKQRLNEAEGFVSELLGLVPEAKALTQIESLPAEERLKMFDLLITLLERGSQGTGHDSRAVAIAMLAGYVATVAAGGAPSISLAEETKRADVIAWAYTLGGVGEKVLWTSSFDGLGRLVSRELSRVYRATDAPTCDFSWPEARVLADTALSDPFVRLRIKQARMIEVELLPGVNVPVPLDTAQSETRTTPALPSHQAAQREMLSDSQLISTLVETLWPHFAERIQKLQVRPPAYSQPSSASTPKPRSKKKDQTHEFKGQKRLLDP